MEILASRCSRAAEKIEAAVLDGAAFKKSRHICLCIGFAAFDWRDAMQKRYPDDQGHIEPAPDAEITFPLGDDDYEGETIGPSHVAVIRCPHCQAAVSFPAFDEMICCRCPQCDGFIDVMPPVI